MANWQPLVDELIRDRGPQLVAYAAMLVGRDGDAEDLVHDAIVKTFSKRRKIGSVNEAHAYVRKAMPSIVIDRTRSAASRRRAAARSFERPQEAADLDAGVDLRRALRTLAPREQVCVVLRYFDDLTVPQVATQLGLADGTVKRYLANARTHLAQELDITEDWDDPRERADVVAVHGGKRS
jgi:RNA polymerase sigma factor (sigma-70 family)